MLDIYIFCYFFILYTNLWILDTYTWHDVWIADFPHVRMISVIVVSQKSSAGGHLVTWVRARAAVVIWISR